MGTRAKPGEGSLPFARVTRKQMAAAADIALRYANTFELSDEDKTHVQRAAHLMGTSALAGQSEGTDA